MTAAAFLAQSDAAQLRVLVGLRGVGVAVASVILHFGHPGRYPIYDVRVRTALRRMGDPRQRFPPTAAGWAAYAAVLRGIGPRHHVSLRTLDKALWRLRRLAERRARAKPAERACATLALLREMRKRTDAFIHSGRVGR